MQKLGKDLEVGDCVSFWFGKDYITQLTPYNGPLAYLWGGKGKARLAQLAINKTGITIDPQIMYEVIATSEAV